MKYLDKELEDLRNNLKNLSFHEIIRIARERTGLIQYRVAGFLDIGINRLKNLESGYIRSNPRWDEIEKLSNFYELPKKIMTEKAKHYVNETHYNLKKQSFSDDRK